jgi:acylphosphatase
MSDRVRRRVIVRGRVQGVWFRESTRQEAETAGVAGWVRNLPDGTVEAVFEGDAAAVERVLAFCRVGPSAAQVTALDVHEEAVVNDVAFEVRPTPPTI